MSTHPLLTCTSVTVPSGSVSSMRVKPDLSSNFAVGLGPSVDVTTPKIVIYGWVGGVKREEEAGAQGQCWGANFQKRAPSCSSSSPIPH